MIDIDVKSIGNDLFDIAIAENGDLATTEGFDTALKMSLFEERRADRTEVVPAENRRGWWANSLFDEVAFEIGSKLWLLDQARLTQDTLNKAIDFVQQATNWLVEDDHLQEVRVSGVLRPETIILTIQLLRDGSIVDSQSFDIWQATGRSLD